jgi:uncharacterized LabA/DUF88 family protein
MDASMPTAIFVDAGYFLKRFASVYPDRDAEDAVIVARSLHEMALDHLRQRGGDDRRDLYRIFVYDCLPLLKVALRLGRLQDRRAWRMKPDRLRALLRKQIDFSDLTDDDFAYDVKQKGTDMGVGLDIASVSYRRQADQIVLVAGDSDFVPAAKLARREGVDFILDPMWSPIADDLHEHVDGLRSTCPRPASEKASE